MSSASRAAQLAACDEEALLSLQVKEK